ncbi:putative phosphoglycerate mutase [Pseudochrobactrum saccharolyticum]|uniref:Putative phosphoglycerate mutase n=1 Tax=Pseudochrobactrum saccharolyticum TaxID=354352 RepID=A0A7W8EMX9_9HYPH|nr:histidine phosphatase family protein [Pseudochrobactrum saccharolyticum]KAB0540144.1 histidine phosphatase family protein [Pseudochrobactrum saccharolyticum]MBB5089639.1 putative phosphoglycerate mutase [Pseudochrobactrum saccharolyticum]
MAREIIYFSRHGETDWNVSQRVQGQMDIDINAHGRTQADRNGDMLKSLIGTAEGFDFVASPLRRTRETMERIRTRMGLDPLAYRTDPLLMEVHFGDWQGHMMEEFEAAGVGSASLLQQRERDKWNFVPPGEHAESYMILSERVAKWLESVKGKTVCVTHGGCIRTLFYLVEGMSGQDAAHLSVPQDKLLKLENNRLEWV